MVLYSLSFNPLPLQVILLLLIPIGTLASGDLISRLLLRSATRNPAERLLVDFAVGTGFAISVLLLAGLAGILVPAELALTAVFGVCCARGGLKVMARKGSILGDHRPGKLDLATAIVFLGYVVKVAVMASTKPIQDSDPMSLYIPAARVFTTLGKIPVFDQFHFWNTFFEPGTPLLFSWAFTLSGSVQSEAYRVVPALPFMLLPIAVFAFVLETFKSREAASIALILTVFMPAVDFMLDFALYYTDVFAVLLLLIALTFYQRIPSERFWAESIVGISLGLALLFKYDVGLFATGFVGLMTMSRMFAKPSVTRVIRTLGVVAFSAVFVYTGDRIWNLLAAGYIADLTLLVVIGALVLATYRSPVEPGERITARSFVVVPIFMLPSIVWGIRSLLVGNSLFGVFFLRLPSASQGNLVSAATNPFSTVTIFAPFVHPLYNAFLFPISIIALLYVSRKQISAGIIIPFLLYFLYYLTVIGDPPSGRHLLIDGILLVAMMAFFLTDYKPLRADFLRHTVMIFCCATSVLAWPTLYFYAIQSPYHSPLHDLGLVAFPSYATSSLGIFAQYGLPLYAVLGAVIGVGYFLGARSRGSVDGNLRRIGTVAFISILLVGSSLQSIPYLELASSTTNGNILSFSSSGSYYRSDLNVAANVSKILPENSSVITWVNPALSFTYPRVLDLARSGIHPLTPILQGLDGGDLSTALVENGFDYLLLPSSNSGVWSSFQAYAKQTLLLQTILANDWIVPVKTFPNWTLYKVVVPS